MPRLIHLNGPPGIGKSTLAQIYADDHPGVLNLDIDTVRCLIGGWRERFGEAGELVRPIARSMADTHLRAGHDVVMPQYLGKLSEVERFEAVASASGASFCEVVLLDTLDNSIERFSQRGLGEDLPWHDQVRHLVELNGGTALLVEMYERLCGVLQSRPSYAVVPSGAGAVSETYEALTAALA